MCIKRKINNLFIILRNIWGKLRMILFIPVFLIIGVLNIWNVHDILRPNEYSKYFIDHRMMLLIPIGISILLIPSIFPCLEDSGRELLYINRTYFFIESMVVISLYCVLVTVEFICFYRPILELKLELYIKYITCIFMFSGVILFLAYRLKKMSICIMFLFFLYSFEWIADFGVIGCPSIFSWNYGELSYLIELFLMIMIGFFCWRDYFRQLQLYCHFDD